MRRLHLAALAVAAALASPGLADKPDKAKGKKDKKATAAFVGFSVKEREKVQVYFVERHGRGKCPPGLAKKNNGCLPPGQARKRYAVGSPLPAGVRIDIVPPEIEVRIGSPPAGYRYAVVDGDLLKLAIGTLLVVDAVEGLVR